MQAGTVPAPAPADHGGVPMVRSVPLALLAGTVLLTSCGNEGRTGPRGPAPVAWITLDRTSVTLMEGEQTQLTAQALDAEGNVLEGRAVDWTSADATIASVSATGVVTALRPATVRITASVEGKVAAATVVVTGIPIYDLIHNGWPDIPVGDWRLFRTPLDGGPAQAIVPPDLLPNFGFTRPAVSPDGQRLVFSAFETYGNAIYVFTINADGTNLRQLTTGGRESQATWSPDGQRIAYVSWPRDGHADIWVVNSDGTNPVNITAARGSDNQHSPAWSHELAGGSRIVFGEGDGTYSNLWTMRPDGSDRRQVTSGRHWWDDDPSWAPDGTHIAFMREGPGTDGDFEIWVAAASGAGASPLVDLPGSQSYPAWSPDGRLIAFTSFHEEPFVLYTVARDGTRLTRRTHHAWWSNQPAWGLRR
jgi:tricorn protease-like protein